MKCKATLWITVGMLALSLVIAAQPTIAQEDLTELFTSSDGALTFNYPEGWSAEEFLVPGVALVINREATEDAIADYLSSPAPDDVIIQIVGPQATSFALPDFAATSLEEALEPFIQDAENVTFGDIEPISLSRYDGLVVTGKNAETEAILMVLDAAGEFMFVSAQSMPGAYAPIAETVMAIVDTLKYIPQEDETFTFEGSDITFDYPVGWLKLNDDGQYHLMNKATTGSGQVFVTITPYTAFSQHNVSADADATTLASRFAGFTYGVENELSEPEDVIYGINEGTQFKFTGKRETFANNSYEGIVVILTIDDTPIVIVATTVLGELPDFDADITHIIESIALSHAE